MSDKLKTLTCRAIQVIRPLLPSWFKVNAAYFSRHRDKT